MAQDAASQKYVLAIDLGTGGPKAGLVSQDGQVISGAAAPVRLFFLPAGGAEHDPAEWWYAVTTCVKEVLRNCPVPVSSIIAVAVTSMWGVTLPVDEHGNPLMNAMSWMDMRGAPYCHELIKGFPSVEGYKLSLLLKYVDKHGFPPSPTDALGHMLFIKHAKPEVYARTYKFFEPMDYLNMRLTGKFTATQNTMLPMLVVDNRRLDRTEYDPWLVKMSTIDSSKLPDLLPIDGIIGNLTPAAAQELGLSPDTPVVCGVNDNATSAIGAGTVGDGEPAAVMGSSGHLAFHLPFRKSDITRFVSTIPSGVKDQYLFWGDLGNNGKVLDSCLRLLLCDADIANSASVPSEMYERADRIAATVPAGQSDLLFLPWFNGALSPGSDEYLRGGFINISHKTDRAHMMRAVYEGLAMNWRWLRSAAESLSGRTFKYWRLTGGGSLSDIWSQTMADVVGIPMRRQANPRQHNVLGMGLLAFQRLGMLKVEDIPDMVKFDRVFEPDPKNLAFYNGLYAQFTAAREKTRPVFHALNKAG